MSSPRRLHREIEIKLRVADQSALLRKLEAFGFSADGRVFERNTLFDTPDSYFRRTMRLLRIRIEIPAASAGIKAGKRTALVTFKAPLSARRHSRYKEKLESEMTVRQPEAWSRALVALGFKPGFQYEKYRSSFRFRSVYICLDETPIGSFLELEGAPAMIDLAARRLGYSPRDYIRATYWDLYAADCARRGTSPGNLLFRT